MTSTINVGECGCDVHIGHREFDRLKKEYDELPQRKKDELGYEAGLHELLTSLVQKMDQTIARNKEQCVRDNQPRPIKRADQERLDALKQLEQGAQLARAVIASDIRALIGRAVTTVQGQATAWPVAMCALPPARCVVTAVMIGRCF